MKYRTVSELCLPERLGWEVGSGEGGSISVLFSTN